MQDTQLMEPFEVNVAFIMNAYLCFARQTGCRPGMAVNDAADAADSDSHWRASPAEREKEASRTAALACDGARQH